MLVAVTEFALSALLRSSTEVLSHLADGDVILRRRGKAPLRLTLVGRDDERDEAYLAAIKLLRNVFVHRPEVMVEALDDAFPWVEFLPPDDRGTFADELSRTLIATADLDTTAPVAQLIVEWRATAAVHADPKLAGRLLQPVEATGERVPIPSGA